MNRRSRQCTGKVRYWSRKDARAALRRLKGAGRAEGHLQPYICDYCGHFHLGHIPPEVSRGEIEKHTWRNS